MRREIRHFEAEFDGFQPLWRLHELHRRVGFWILRARARRLQVGSHSWHLIQERLSRRSSVGTDLEMRSWFYMATLRQCGPDLCIFPGVIIYFPANVSFGTNVFLNRGVFISAPAPILIGDNVLIGPYVVMNSGNHKFSDRSISISDQGHILSPIVIGDDVWIGANVTIVAGVSIGTGAIVAAGAVVTHDVASFSIVAGVPARVIATRGAEN